jgi:hypothetical protein
MNTMLIYIDTAFVAIVACSKIAKIYAMRLVARKYRSAIKTLTNKDNFSGFGTTLTGPGSSGSGNGSSSSSGSGTGTDSVG